MSTVGRAKAEVLRELLLDINPEAEVEVFPAGVNSGNIDQFLNNVDLYVDGLDFFAFAARELVFASCAERALPATTVAPIGMGAALLNFMPGQMTFEQYFGWRGTNDTEKALRLLVGLAPAGLHRGYLVDPTRVDLESRRAPSTIMGCQLCAAIAATEALKILLGRGKVLAAPWGMHFDGYRNKLVRTWRPGGNRNPLQQLMLALGRRQLAKK
jgi:molybdopterin/thiamine biosynthesis adenylyltransferase